VPFATIVGSITIDVLASAIFGVVLWGVGRVIFIGVHQRIWRLASVERMVLCVARSGEGSDYDKPLTGIGQVRAATLITPSLQRAYPTQRIAERVLLASDQIGTDLERDVVALGGGKSNCVTRRLLAELCEQHGFPATTTETGLRWTGEQPGTFDAVREGRVVVRDFGLVAQVANPFNHRRRAVILAGASTFGTVAAARFLIERGARLRGDWVAIVQSRVEDGFALEPQRLRLARRRRDGTWR
jgi:hypothetical protein